MRTQTTPSLSSNEKAVLLAVSYASKRWDDPSLQDIMGQLRAPRLTSGAGLLPTQISGSTVERTLTRLRREHQLIESLPALRRNGRRWVVSELGQRRAQQLLATPQTDTR